VTKSGATELFIDLPKPEIPHGFFVDATVLKTSSAKAELSIWLELVNQLKTAVCNHPYELAINLVSTETILQLNQEWRNLDAPTDILSFSYSESEGEIFLCPKVIKQRHSEYDRTLGNFVIFLIIHGLHHLNGFDHGFDMDQAENQIRQRFGV
jgi:rRNA maturation RNase YbeY